MIRIGICDDDINFLEKFKNMIEKFFAKLTFIKDEIEYICYDDAQKVFEKFFEDKIDVYFLDIEYGEDLGMDVAKRLNKMCVDVGIVYVTNYENYVSRAFVCRPLGFLRKNHIEEDMKFAMASVIDYLENINREFVFYNNKNRLLVKLCNIQYVHIYDHIMELVLLNKRIQLRDKLSRVENSLCEQGFVKINRSCLVNLKYIEDIIDVKIILYSKENLYISEDKKGDVFVKWQYYKMNFIA